jgi:hypothetical protein
MPAGVALNQALDHHCGDDLDAAAASD